MATPIIAIIVGGGIAGPAAAVALQEIGIACTIYELRPAPATIGGAIGLPPNAVRALNHWALYEEIAKKGHSYEKMDLFSISSGRLLGSLPFGGKERFGYDSMRCKRSDLQKLLLDKALAAGAVIKYSKRLVGVREGENSIAALFEDGEEAVGHILLGCDGIHSNVRIKYVDSSRSPTYTGISSAYGFVPVYKITAPIHFNEPAMNSSHQGSLLSTYCDVNKQTVFLAAVMEVTDPAGHDGWRARGRVQEAARNDLLERFETPRIPCIAEMTRAIDELYFYPVYTLSNGGRWFKGRAVLVGDAAHAMPPGGQSVGLAFEDVIILSRLLSSASSADFEQVFARYDLIRRPRVEEHYKQATSRWEGVRTRHPWIQWVIELIIWFYLLTITRHADESYSYDPVTVNL